MNESEKKAKRTNGINTIGKICAQFLLEVYLHSFNIEREKRYAEKIKWISASVKRTNRLRQYAHFLEMISLLSFFLYFVRFGLCYTRGSTLRHTHTHTLFLNNQSNKKIHRKFRNNFSMKNCNQNNRKPKYFLYHGGTTIMNFIRRWKAD